MFGLTLAKQKPQAPTIKWEDNLYVSVRLTGEPDLIDWFYNICPNKSRYFQAPDKWFLRNNYFRKFMQAFGDKYDFILEMTERQLELLNSALNPAHVSVSVEVPFEQVVRVNLFEHQKAGVSFLAGVRRAILGDDMGLGKTLQAITVSSFLGGRVLIVAPKSLVLNWEREIKKFTFNPSVQVVSSGDIISTGYIYTIINYSILDNYVNKLVLQGYDTVILDESHLIKNPVAKRTRYIYDVVKNIPNRFLLTGTPIKNKIRDFYTQIDLVSDVYSHLRGKHSPHLVFEKSFQYQSDLVALRNTIEMFYLRRTKDEVLDLPDKIRTDIFVSGDKVSVAEYDRLLGEFKKANKTDAEKRAMIGLINRMKMAAALSKVSATVELAKNIAEQGNQVLIFTDFQQVLDQIVSGLGSGAVQIDGRSSSINRDRAVGEFQSGKATYFVGGIKSAGVGLTLTAGSHVLFNDWSYCPTDQDQAEDRAYRIGQTSVVNVYNMVATNVAFDEKINRIIDSKRQVISLVFEGKDYEDRDETAIYDEIMAEIRRG